MNEDQKIFSLSQKMSKKKFDPTLEEPLKFKQSIVGKYSINHFGSEEVSKEELGLKEKSNDKLGQKKTTMKIKKEQIPKIHGENPKRKSKLDNKGNVKEIIKQSGENYKELSKRKESLLKNKKHRIKHKPIMQEKNEGKAMKTADLDDREKTRNNLKCVVCSEMLLYSVDNPACVLALMSRTNIMGKRIKTKRPNHVYIKQDTFAYSYELLKRFLTFDNASFNWYDSLCVQTCGHSIHYKCYFVLMNSILLENEQPKNKNDFEKYTKSEILTKKFFTRNFMCPVCLQLANTIFLIPTTSTLNISISYAPPIYSLILTCLTDSSRTYLDDQHKLLTNHYLSTTNLQNTNFRVFVNIFRNNIEIELMHKQLLKQQSSQLSTLCPTFNFTPSKKIHTGILYNYCSKVVRTNPVNIIAKILRIFDPETDEKQNFQQKNIALLDLKAILTTTVLFLPQPSNSLMRSIICFFANLYVLQILFWLVLFAGESEISKFIDRNDLSETQLEFIMKKLLGQLKENYRLPPNFGENIPIYETLASRVEDFLKYSVLLYQAVVQPTEPFVDDIATMTMEDLYNIIMPEEEIQPDVSSIRCYGWDEETLTTYISKFLKNIEFFSENSLEIKLVRDIMLADWKPPKLYNLPGEMDMTLLDKYIDMNNGKRTKFLAVCLSCSKFFKLPKHYKHDIQNKSAVVRMKNHSLNCGRGTSVFLMIPSKKALILWQKNFFVWSCLYDEHGSNNKKSLLRLDRDRKNFLQNMWLFNHFDVFCEPIT